MFDTLVEHVADEAAECANLELWLHLSGPCHCAVDRHDSAQAKSLQITDLVNGRQVAEGDLEPLVLLDRVTLIGQEHSEPLLDIGLKAYEFTLEPVHELGVLPLEAAHMLEVDL